MTITAELDADGCYRLIVTSLAGKSVAGPRLERGAPLPIEHWLYFDEASAIEAAAKLQAYVDGHCKIEKRKKKKSARSELTYCARITKH